MKTAGEFTIRRAGTDKGIVTGVTIISGTMTGLGLVQDAQGAMDIARSVGVAGAVAGGMLIFYRWQLDRIINAASKWARIAALASTCLAAPVFAFSSSQYNATAISGEDAQETHLEAYVETVSDAWSATYTQAGRGGAVLTDFELEAARYREAARNERENGSYTGVPGDGAVAQALDGMAGRLESLTNAVRQMMSSIGDQAAGAEALLASMRDVIHENTGIDARMRSLAGQSNELRRMLSDLANGDIAGTVQRMVEGLPGFFSNHSGLSANAATAMGQRGALSRLNADLERTAGILSAAVTDLGGAEGVSFPRMEMITASRAIAVHWREYVPTWIVAIAIDLVPLWIAIFAFLSVIEKSREERAMDDVLNTTVGEIAKRRFGEDIIRSAAIRPDVANRVNDGLQGHSDSEQDDDPKTPTTV